MIQRENRNGRVSARTQERLITLERRSERESERNMAMVSNAMVMQLSVEIYSEEEVDEERLTD